MDDDTNKKTMKIGRALSFAFFQRLQELYAKIAKIFIKGKQATRAPTSSNEVVPQYFIAYPIPRVADTPSSTEAGTKPGACPVSLDMAHKTLMGPY